LRLPPKGDLNKAEQSKFKLSEAALSSDSCRFAQV